jgi:hypothetical protein
MKRFVLLLAVSSFATSLLVTSVASLPAAVDDRGGKPPIITGKYRPNDVIQSLRRHKRGGVVFHRSWFVDIDIPSAVEVVVVLNGTDPALFGDIPALEAMGRDFATAQPVPGRRQLRFAAVKDPQTKQCLIDKLYGTNLITRTVLDPGVPCRPTNWWYQKDALISSLPRH